MNIKIGKRIEMWKIKRIKDFEYKEEEVKKIEKHYTNTINS